MSENQPPANPYVGPRSFTAGEAFYGREREVRSLTALLLAERIVLLHSPSGAGKTSLIQAGLIPQLAQRLRILPVIRLNLEPPPEALGVPGLNRYTLSALTSLEEGFAEVDQLPVAELAGLSLAAYLEKRYPPDEKQANSLLILDQFEELLTVAPVEREQKAAFFEGLGEALQSQHLWALIAIREDYMGGLAPYSRHIPNRLGVTFRLDLLGVEAARRPIQEPARSAGVDFSDDAAGQLVTDLSRILVQQPDGSYQAEAGLYVEPVQLQVVCYSLWQSGAAEDGQIDTTDIERVGDVDQALAKYYASTVEAVCVITGTEQRLVREWFSERLITPMRIRGQVLKGPETSEGLDNRTLREIEAAHLVRGDTRGGKTWYELSHDRLVEPVLQDNAAWFESHLGVLQKQAALWEQQERPEALLLRGKLLSQAEEEARSLRLTPDEQAYLEASRRLQRQERRQRQFISALVVLLGVAILLGLIALSFFNRSNSNLAEARAANTQAAQHLSDANAANTLSAASAATAQAEAIARGTAESVALAERDVAAAARVQAEDQTNRARAGELAAFSLGQYGQNLDLAFLLAVRAYQTANTYHSQQALFKSWTFSPPLTAILQGHSGNVRSVAWSPDGRLASGSNDGDVIIWNLESGRPEQILEGHSELVYSVVWSRDGRLVSGANDGTIIVWNLESGEAQQTFYEENSVDSLAWSPDGRLASGLNDGTIKIWDLESGQPPLILQRDADWANNVAWSLDGRLASGSDDNKVIIWDLEKGEPDHILEGHTNWVSSLAWSPDGRLASGTIDGEVIIWDLVNEQSAQTLQEQSGYINSLAWSADGRLASASGDGTVIVWGLDSGLPTQTLEGHTDSVRSVAWSRDGRLASGANDTKVLLWDLGHSQPAQTLWVGGGVRSAGWMPDGSLGFNTEYGTVGLWDPEHSQFARALKEHTERIYEATWSADGRLATGSLDGMVIVWDMESDQAIQTLKAHAGYVRSLAWSPDGRLASGGCGELNEDGGCVEGEIIIWDLASGEPPKALPGHSESVSVIAWSADGRLASGSDDGTVIVWDLGSGQPANTLQADSSGVYTLAWSPDGRLTFDLDDKVIIRDLENGQPDEILQVESMSVTRNAWSPDGRLATGTGDGEVIIWDLESGKEALILDGSSDSIWSLAWSQDERLAVGSHDGTIQVWETNPDAWVEQVCRRAGRDMTRAEWEQYITWKPYERTCPQWPAGE